MVPLAPKLKVITYHFISYRRKSVFNLVEIQNTFIPYLLRMKVTFEAKVFHLRYDVYDIISRLDFFPAKNSDINFAEGDTSYAYRSIFYLFVFHA